MQATNQCMTKTARLPIIIGHVALMPASLDPLLGIIGTAALFGFVGTGLPLETISCHHNCAEEEVHGGRSVWGTRKGAIRARVAFLGEYCLS